MDEDIKNHIANLGAAAESNQEGVKNLGAIVQNHDGRLGAIEDQPSFYQRNKKEFAVGGGIILALAGAATVVGYNALKDAKDIGYNAQDAADENSKQIGRNNDTAEEALASTEANAEAINSTNDIAKSALKTAINAKDSTEANSEQIDYNNESVGENSKQIGYNNDTAEDAEKNASAAKNATDEIASSSLWSNFRDAREAFNQSIEDLQENGVRQEVDLELNYLNLTHERAKNLVPALENILEVDDTFKEVYQKLAGNTTPYLNMDFADITNSEAAAMRLILTNTSDILEDYDDADLEEDFEDTYGDFMEKVSDFELQKDDVELLKEDMTSSYEESLVEYNVSKAALQEEVDDLLEHGEINESEAKGYYEQISSLHKTKVKNIQQNYQSAIEHLEDGINKTISSDAVFDKDDADDDNERFQEQYGDMLNLGQQLGDKLDTWTNGANVYDVGANWWTNLTDEQQDVVFNSNLTGNETFHVYMPNDGETAPKLMVYDGDGNFVSEISNDDQDFIDAMTLAAGFDTTPYFMPDYCGDASTRFLVNQGSKCAASGARNETVKYGKMLQGELNRNPQYITAIGALEDNDFHGDIHTVGRFFADPNETTLARAMKLIAKDAINNSSNWYASGESNMKRAVSRMNQYRLALDTIDTVAVENDIRDYNLGGDLAEVTIMSNLNPNYQHKESDLLDGAKAQLSRVKNKVKNVFDTQDTISPKPVGYAEPITA